MAKRTRGGPAMVVALTQLQARGLKHTRIA